MELVAPFKSQRLFDEIHLRNLLAYNALMSSLIRSRDVKSAVALMDEMEEKHIEHDYVTYHTMFSCLMRTTGIEGTSKLYYKMVDRNFVPKTRTVVMLVKFFCENHQLELGLHLWGYLVEKGYCPHGHALDLLLRELCSRVRVIEAFECSLVLTNAGEREAYERSILLDINLSELKKLIQKLHALLPH